MKSLSSRATSALYTLTHDCRGQRRNTIYDTYKSCSSKLQQTSSDFTFFVSLFHGVVDAVVSVVWQRCFNNSEAVSEQSSGHGSRDSIEIKWMREGRGKPNNEEKRDTRSELRARDTRERSEERADTRRERREVI